MLGASARYSCLHTPVETGTPPRQNELHILRSAFLTKTGTHPFRHFASFRKASFFYINSLLRIERVGKEALRFGHLTGSNAVKFGVTEFSVFPAAVKPQGGGYKNFEKRYHDVWHRFLYHYTRC